MTRHGRRGARAPVRPALHRAALREIFYVLDGKVRVVVEDGEGGRVDRLLTTGEFGYVPAGHLHSFRVESHRARTLGVSTGGFERFFAAPGAPIGARIPPERPGVPSPSSSVTPPGGSGTTSTTTCA